MMSYRMFYTTSLSWCHYHEVISVMSYGRFYMMSWHRWHTVSDVTFKGLKHHVRSNSIGCLFFFPQGQRSENMNKKEDILCEKGVKTSQSVPLWCKRLCITYVCPTYHMHTFHSTTLQWHLWSCSLLLLSIVKETFVSLTWPGAVESKMLPHTCRANKACYNHPVLLSNLYASNRHAHLHCRMIQKDYWKSSLFFTTLPFKTCNNPSLKDLYQPQPYMIYCQVL